jgi:hypothetical protein
MKPTSRKPARRFTAAMRAAYLKRDKRQDSRDPENPTLPPEAWDGAIIGKYYRPPKPLVGLFFRSGLLDRALGIRLTSRHVKLTFLDRARLEVAERNEKREQYRKIRLLKKIFRRD